MDDWTRHLRNPLKPLDDLAREMARREMAGEPAMGGFDEVAEETPTIPLACGHLGVEAKPLWPNEPPWWCPECCRYKEKVQ